MGAPTSYSFSEKYLQNIENRKIFDILLEHLIIVYPLCWRYIRSIQKWHNQHTWRSQSIQQHNAYHEIYRGRRKE